MSHAKEKAKTKRTFVKLECSPVRDGEFLLVVVGVFGQARGDGTVAVLRGRPRGRRGLGAVGHGGGARRTHCQSLLPHPAANLLFWLHLVAR